MERDKKKCLIKFVFNLRITDNTHTSVLVDLFGSQILTLCHNHLWKFKKLLISICGDSKLEDLEWDLDISILKPSTSHSDRHPGFCTTLFSNGGLALSLKKYILRRGSTISALCLCENSSFRFICVIAKMGEKLKGDKRVSPSSV